jgi:hypothetical protein
MTQVHAINKKGKIIVIKKDFEDENREQFLKRSWWIAKHICNNEKKDLQTIENESYMWSCMNEYGVKYAQ